MMVKLKLKNWLWSSFCLFSFCGLQAQHVSINSGFASSNIPNQGSVDCSFGQVFYTRAESTFSIQEGIQQPYDLSTGLNEPNASVGISAYPNPTSNNILLSMGDVKIESLTYQLFDSQGKEIASEKITGANETINMEGLPSANYLLSISRNKRVIKSFNIIKN